MDDMMRELGSEWTIIYWYVLAISDIKPGTGWNGGYGAVDRMKGPANVTGDQRWSRCRRSGINTDTLDPGCRSIHGELA